MRGGGGEWEELVDWKAGRTSSCRLDLNEFVWLKVRVKLDVRMRTAGHNTGSLFFSWYPTSARPGFKERTVGSLFCGRGGLFWENLYHRWNSSNIPIMNLKQRMK